MRALTFHGPGQVHHEQVPDPGPLEPTDVVVRVESAAICGSDLHVYHGRETGLDAGTVLGHEFAGEIVEAGGAVRGFRRGDRVIAPFTTSCGACFYCRRGLTSRCAAGQLFGWVERGLGLQGGQAEYVRVPLADSTLLALPDGLTAETGLLLGDVLSTGYFCAEQAGIDPEGTYVVLGCGPVGLMALVGARELGAERLLAVDRVPERLRLAERFGARAVHLEEQDPAAVVAEATEGRGADAVLEVVGSADAHRLAVELLRPGGTLSVVGVHNGPGFGFSPTAAYDKNLTYRVGRCPARALMERLVPVARSGRYPLDAVYSHRLPLEQGERGYRIFAGREDGCTKVVLRP